MVKLVELQEKIENCLNDNKIEEDLFEFNIEFFHLLSLLYGYENRKTTINYCNYLLLKCFTKIVSAVIKSGGSCETFGEDINDSIKAIMEQFENVDDKLLISTFNGETDKGFDAQGKLAIVFYICNKRYGTTWKDLMSI